MNRIGYLKRFTFLFPLTFTIAVLALLLRASPASAAPNCLQDVYGTKKLNCTANDVTVSFADNVRNLDGSALTGCSPGTFSFIADFHVITTATARENVGIYFATAGQSTALKGTCSDNIVGDLHACPNGPTVTCGSPTYTELDTSLAGDNCGDTTSAHPEVITIQVNDAQCVAGPDGKVRLPNCTSWQQPGGAILCKSQTPNYPWVPAATPGTVSKCGCDNSFEIPVTVQTPGVSVSKSATPLTQDDPGGTVTYTVVVTNDKSNFGNVTINQICDSAYGNIATAVTVPAQTACPKGLTGLDGTATPVAGNCTVPSAPIAPNGTFTCKFTANQGEHSDVKNIATANGVGDDGTTPFSGVSNQIETTVGEADSKAVTAKTFESTTNACATVRYKVDVHNTSATGSDEVLTISGLTDNPYGDITKLQTGVIVGTTCGQPIANGLGTLHGSPGVPFGNINPDGHYVCEFDGQFCSAPDTNGCISQSDSVTPTLTGDEGAAEVISNTAGALTVKECVTATTQ
jgi:hypothetical protein